MKKRAEHPMSWFKVWVEQYGYLLITGVCVMVIIGTAIWTDRTHQQPKTSGLEAHPAVQHLQQSLAEAATPSPTPECWIAPLAQAQILAPFATSALIPYANGLWKVHVAADLAAAANEPVLAMHAGTVVGVEPWDDQAWMVTIQHTEVVTAVYAGLNKDIPVHPGDTVQTGDEIGSVSMNIKEDAIDGPHLHLEAMQHGQLIDPCLLWSKTQ